MHFPLIAMDVMMFSKQYLLASKNSNTLPCITAGGSVFSLQPTLPLAGPVLLMAPPCKPAPMYGLPPVLHSKAILLNEKALLCFSDKKKAAFSPKKAASCITADSLFFQRHYPGILLCLQRQFSCQKTMCLCHGSFGPVKYIIDK